MQKRLLVAMVAAMVQSAAANTITNVAFTQTGFTPSPVTVNAGDTVTWHDNSVVPAVISSLAGDPEQFVSPVLLQGLAFSHTFQTPGVDFYTDLVLGANGAVVVRPAIGPAIIDINILNTSFDLGQLTVVAGDTVVWRDASPLPAVLGTTGNSAVQFVSPALLQGGTFSFTFKNPGTVSYQDLVNGVSAQILVQAAPAAPVPETATFTLTGLGLLGIGGFRRRKLAGKRA